MSGACAPAERAASVVLRAERVEAPGALGRLEPSIPMRMKLRMTPERRRVIHEERRFVLKGL